MVRRSTEADIPLMRRLWDEFSTEAHYTPYPSGPFDPVLVRDHVALVAEEDGEIVGTLYANLSSEHMGYVFGVYTVPPARGRGVGRALMQEFYAHLGFEDASRMLRARVDRLLED